MNILFVVLNGMNNGLSSDGIAMYLETKTCFFFGHIALGGEDCNEGGPDIRG